MKVRLAFHLLSLPLFLSALVLTNGALAQAPAGYQASGTVTLHGPRGDETGAITVAWAGAGNCKVTITLAGENGRNGARTLTAVSDGHGSSVRGPADLVRAVPLPMAAAQGCPLLPRPGLAPAVTWTAGGQQATLEVDGQKVTESVAGEMRLDADFTSIAPAAFTAADFAPPPPARPITKKPRGGGQ